MLIISLQWTLLRAYTHIEPLLSNLPKVCSIFMRHPVLRCRLTALQQSGMYEVFAENSPNFEPFNSEYQPMSFLFVHCWFGVLVTELVASTKLLYIEPVS